MNENDKLILYGSLSFCLCTFLLGYSIGLSHLHLQQCDRAKLLQIRSAAELSYFFLAEVLWLVCFFFPVVQRYLAELHSSKNINS